MDSEEKKYQDKKDVLTYLEDQVSKHQEWILNYENKKRLNDRSLDILTRDKLGEYLLEDPKDGEIIKYKGVTYEIGDTSDMILHMGNNDFSSSCLNDPLEELLEGGACPILTVL